MYDLVDRRLDQLCRGGGFLIWAMRVWTRAVGNRYCPSSALAPTFCRMQIVHALGDFHIAMSLLNRHGLSKIAIAPMNAPAVSENEAVLLALWRHAGAGNAAVLRKCLGLLVDEDAVGSVEGAMIRAVAKLGEAGLHPQDPARAATRDMR